MCWKELMRNRRWQMERMETQMTWRAANADGMADGEDGQTGADGNTDASVTANADGTADGSDGSGLGSGSAGMNESADGDAMAAANAGGTADGSDGENAAARMEMIPQMPQELPLQASSPSRR